MLVKIGVVVILYPESSIRKSPVIHLGGCADREESTY